MRKSISIRNRITRLIIAITTGVLTVAAVLFSLLSYNSMHDLQKRAFLASMGVTAEHCVTPLLFDDPDGAEQILHNYRAMSDVEQAVILDSSGGVFASYKTDQPFRQEEREKSVPVAELHGGNLFLAVAIRSNGEEIGQLHVVVSTKSLANQLTNTILFILATIPLLIFFAYMFGSRLQKRISDPLLHLAKAAEEFQYGQTVPEILEQPAGTRETDSLTSSLRGMFSRVATGEEELNRASAFLHTIVDSMPSLLIVFDHDNTITLCNSSARNMSSDPEPLGMNLYEAFPFLKKISKTVQAVHIHGTKEILRAERIGAGSLEQCDIDLFPLRDTTRSGVVMTLTDVTELANKDQQLIQIQKMETVGMLAGGLAHDFNNILSGIVGTLSLMNYNDDEPIDPVELQEYITVMSHAADRAKEMIDQLLSLSHKSDASYSSVNLVDVVNHVAIFCEHSFDRKVTIQKKIGVSRAPISGNASQLEQVILNLCVNAAHAMTLMRPKSEPHGGTLTISLEKQSRPTESEGTSHLMYAITIHDTGVGIPEENLKQIFDPFFTTKEKGTGTGLGLSMVYNIITQHGGELYVDSVVGKGTKVTVLLNPAVVEEVQSSSVRGSVKQNIGEGKRILLIDDDTQIRQVAGKMIQRMGFSVLFAVDGIDGVEQFMEHHSTLDLVLLDMVMPGLSGSEVYTRLREINPNVPVILSSGFSQDERVLATLSKGVAAFVHKPYTIRELQDTFEQVLNHLNG